ncbi:hypothetical protein J6590_100318, partial [Homalodisca vitripennis]
MSPIIHETHRNQSISLPLKHRHVRCSAGTMAILSASHSEIETPTRVAYRLVVLQIFAYPRTLTRTVTASMIDLPYQSSA